MYPETISITINDTCILFDLIELELLELSLDVQQQIITTPFVYEEVKKPQQRKMIDTYILNNKIIIDSKGDVLGIRQMMKQNRELSFTDCSVLELANRHNCKLLTSDNGIRKASKKFDIEARGMLWLFDIFKTRQLLSNETMINKLNYLMKINVRCPKKEIENFIKKLSYESITN